MITSPKTIKPLPSVATLESLHAFSSSINEQSSFPLLCTVPVWSSEWSDLASCASLRERALAALHLLCDDLSAQGLNPSYKLIPTPTTYSSIKLSRGENATSGSGAKTPLPSDEEVRRWEGMGQEAYVVNEGRGPTLILI